MKVYRILCITICTMLISSACLSPNGGFAFSYRWPFNDINANKKKDISQMSLSDPELWAILKKSEEEGWGKLGYAAMCGRIDIIEYRLSQGAAINELTASGTTALDIAIANKRTDIEEYLQNHGGVSGDEILKKPFR